MEEVTILKIGTEEAVKSVNDLRSNIKILKESLGELEIGTEEYQRTLDELKVNQNALKDAMYATSSSMTDVAAAAAGASKSYNSLVHQMAALKEEWRATNDEARRNELGKQIADINQQLKDMDASVGNFSRNVGNYESGAAGLVAKFDQWGGILKQMPPTLGAAKESIGKVGESMQLVGKQPILGIIGLLAPIIMKITDSLKDNETALNAVDKLMKSLQPLLDFVQGVLEGIAKGLAMAVDWISELIGRSDGLKNVISNITGFGNAILQYLLTPIKSAIAGFKGLANIIKDVFTGNFSDVKKHAKEAGEGIADAWKEGFSFKSNFESGQEAGGVFVDGIRANTSKAKEAGAEVAAAFQEGYDEELERIKAENEEWAAAEASAKEEEEYALQLLALEESKKKENEILFQAELDKMAAKEEAAQQEIAFNKAVEEEITRQVEEENEKRKKKEEETAKARIETISAVANATSGILSSLADMYESDEKNSEKNATKIKALRIASATIDMLNGAVTAFTSAMQLGPVAGPIVGAANAAAVVAMGIANINKIKSTNFSRSGGAGASAVSPSSVAVNPPAVETSIPTMRTATSASEEDRLNRMASPQKVYILQSDIEAAGSQSKAEIEESSF